MRDIDEKGAHRTVIRPSPLQSLVTRLEAIQFLDLQPACGVRIDHGTFTSIEVSLPGGHHRVDRVYSYCDAGKRVALTKVADTIIDIADDARR